MEINIFDKEGIYNLDEEYGNDKFFYLSSFSTPKEINKLSKKEPLVDVEHGTYCFDINGYDLKLCTDYLHITLFLDFIKSVMYAGSESKIAVIDNEGGYSYMLSFPIYGSFDNNDDLDKRRIVILDDNNTDNAENITVKNDFIIYKYEFVKQMNEQLHKIYENADEKKCKAIIGEYIETFDEYVNRGHKSYDEEMEIYTKKNIEEKEDDNISDSKCWQGKRIIWAKDLEDYFNSIKHTLIGKTIDKIYIFGGLREFSMWDYEFEYKNGEWYFDGKETNKEPSYYPFKTEDTQLEMDGPIILWFGDTNIEIDYWQGSVVHIAQNTLAKTQYTYNVSTNFSKNIIDHKLVDIQIHKTDKVYFMDFLANAEGIRRKDGDDMFEEIWFVFDNGYKLEITTDHTDYMVVSEVK